MRSWLLSNTLVILEKEAKATQKFLEGSGKTIPLVDKEGENELISMVCYLFAKAVLCMSANQWRDQTQ